MSNINYRKKRDLFKRGGAGLKPDKGNICLGDLTESLSKIGVEASKLELQDNITSCKKSIDITFELENQIKLYRDRMRELRTEIKLSNKAGGKTNKYKGNIESLNKINKKKD